MKYREYKISGIPDEEAADIVVAELADLEFDSFSDYSAQEKSISGYIPHTHAETYRAEIEAWLDASGYRYETFEVADDVNWNSAWESNFEPILLGDRCCIRAPFHEKPEGVEYDIVIMPKMSFGTGHHATTSLMLERILEGSFAGQSGLDMGSGTGVLAILAVKAGALHVDAVDVDRWAFENCLENVDTNGVKGRVDVFLGDASMLTVAGKYDFMLANINRNILLSDMEKYAYALRPGGKILFSGFLEVDVGVIRSHAESLGLKFEGLYTQAGWALVECTKIND